MGESTGRKQKHSDRTPPGYRAAERVFPFLLRGRFEFDVPHGEMQLLRVAR